MLFSYSILPEINAPTRYGDSSMTLIDNICTNKSCDSHVSEVILNDISDHLPIFYITGNMVFKQKKSYIYKQIRVIDNNKLKQLSINESVNVIGQILATMIPILLLNQLTLKFRNYTITIYQ